MTCMPYREIGKRPKPLTEGGKKRLSKSLNRLNVRPTQPPPKPQPLTGIKKRFTKKQLEDLEIFVCTEICGYFSPKKRRLYGLLRELIDQAKIKGIFREV